MTDASTPMTPLTDDERYEMTASAHASQRRNRPRHLVALGAAVLAVGAIALLAAWSSNRGADARLERAREELTQIKGETAKLEQIRTIARERPAGVDPYQPIPTFLSQLEELATEAGLANTPPIPQKRSIAVGGGQRVEWPYVVNDPSLEALLSWVRLAIDRIPGTFPHSIDISPTGEQWRMRVSFARYERG